MSLGIRPISSSSWDDFVSLMQTDSQCSDCWCLNHRAPSGCSTGLEAKKEMQSLVFANKVQGLLAYVNQESVGWIAIEPMSELVGHDCQDSAKEQEWSIHCLFVKDGFRGQGISNYLIKSAIDYAKLHNAKIISAFPIPSENRNRFPPNEAEFSGRFSTYAKKGFLAAGDPSDFYQRVELTL
jgi:predicted GNAT family acetyltransferase